MNAGSSIVRPENDAAPQHSAKTRSTILRGGLLAALVLVVLCYLPSFTGDFTFDDLSTLQTNQSVRNPAPFWTAVFPPAESALGSRPVSNLSFAVSFAVFGDDPWGHRLINVLLHYASGCLLWQSLRLALAAGGRNAAGMAELMAGAAALVWVVHPVHTETVAYISQRTEGLGGFFYFATIFCFLQMVSGKSTCAIWPFGTVIFCALGMLAKEIVVTAPVAVLLLDAGLFSGGIASALRRRARFYACLAATWVVLVPAVYTLGGRGVGSGLGYTHLDYLVLSCRSILTYLKLVIWPAPLIFDHGTLSWVPGWSDWRHVSALTALVAVVVWLWIRRPALGLPGVLFFLMLAPSSSFVPVAFQPVAEHRVYLASSAVIVAVVLCVGRTRRGAFMAICAIWVIGCSVLTWQRSLLYGDVVALWHDNLQKAPQNVRAKLCLGLAHAARGEHAVAVDWLRQYLEAEPRDVLALNGLACAEQSMGNNGLAAVYFRKLLEVQPSNFAALYNLGNVLLQLGEVSESIKTYEHARQVQPSNPDLLHNLGCALMVDGRPQEAEAAFHAALVASPDFRPARDALDRLGNP